MTAHTFITRGIGYEHVSIEAESGTEVEVRRIPPMGLGTFSLY